MGATVTIRLQRIGFAPAGGGEWTAEIAPSRLRPLKLHERGQLERRNARALVSNLPISIAERELGVLRENLRWPESALRAETVEATGPGNIVMISAAFANVSELATGFGQRGVPAEKVASNAVECWRQYERSGAPVGEHLTDQLLLPIALAGSGSFLTMKPTLHTLTNAETIAKFLPVHFHFEPAHENTWMVYT
jgi:RNA 3'-terminal phosphate cyclase (ATP)